jgi:hypothetical protein
MSLTLCRRSSAQDFLRDGDFRGVIRGDERNDDANSIGSEVFAELSSRCAVSQSVAHLEYWDIGNRRAQASSSQGTQVAYTGPLAANLTC